MTVYYILRLCEYDEVNIIMCFPSLLCISTGAVASYVYSRYEDDFYDSLFNCGMYYIQLSSDEPVPSWLLSLCQNKSLCKIIHMVPPSCSFSFKIKILRFCTKRGVR